MKEWFALKNKLKEMGVVSIEFESDHFHIPDAIKFIAASNGKKLTLVNRDSEIFPYKISFVNDGIIFYTVIDLQELEGYFPELAKENDYAHTNS